MKRKRQRQQRGKEKNEIGVRQRKRERESEKDEISRNGMKRWRAEKKKTTSNDSDTKTTTTIDRRRNRESIERHRIVRQREVITEEIMWNEPQSSATRRSHNRDAHCPTHNEHKKKNIKSLNAISMANTLRSKLKKPYPDDEQDDEKNNIFVCETKSFGHLTADTINRRRRWRPMKNNNSFGLSKSRTDSLSVSFSLNFTKSLNLQGNLSYLHLLTFLYSFVNLKFTQVSMIFLVQPKTTKICDEKESTFASGPNGNATEWNNTKTNWTQTVWIFFFSLLFFFLFSDIFFRHFTHTSRDKTHNSTHKIDNKINKGFSISFWPIQIHWNLLFDFSFRSKFVFNQFRIEIAVYFSYFPHEKNTLTTRRACKRYCLWRTVCLTNGSQNKTLTFVTRSHVFVWFRFVGRIENTIALRTCARTSWSHAITHTHTRKLLA